LSTPITTPLSFTPIRIVPPAPLRKDTISLAMVSVSGKFCIFSHKNKQHQRFFQLLPDGQIKDIGGTGQRS